MQQWWERQSALGRGEEQRALPQSGERVFRPLTLLPRLEPGQYVPLGHQSVRGLHRGNELLLLPGIPGPVLGLATGHGAVPLQGEGGDGSEQFQLSGGARHEALAHRLVGEQVFGELAEGGDPSVPGGERQIPLLQQRGKPLRIQGSQPFHKGGTRIHPARLAPSGLPAGVNRARHLAAGQRASMSGRF